MLSSENSNIFKESDKYTKFIGISNRQDTYLF